MSDDVPPMPAPPASSMDPVDRSTLPREDPRQDQRWPTTLDGVSMEQVRAIAELLDAARIAYHVETISPRVKGMSWEGVTGLYDVLVCEEDLPRAVAVLRPAFPERFPGEVLPDDSTFDLTSFGPAPVVLCRLGWARSWDLQAALRRAGLRAIVLPDDVAAPTPPQEESLGAALSEGPRRLLREVEDLTDFGGGTPSSPPIEDRWYVVVVLKPDLQRATTIAAQALGDAFTLDGSAYDG